MSTFREYSHNSSIHGIPEIANKKWTTKTVWIILLICSVSFGAYEISKIIQTFQYGNVVTNIELKSESYFPKMAVNFHSSFVRPLDLAYSAASYNTHVALDGFFGFQLRKNCKDLGHHIDTKNAYNISMLQYSNISVPSIQDILNLTSIAMQESYTSSNITLYRDTRKNIVSLAPKVTQIGMEFLADTQSVSSDSSLILDMNAFCNTEIPKWNLKKIAGVGLEFGDKAEHHSKSTHKRNVFHCGFGYKIKLKERQVKLLSPSCNPDPATIKVSCLHRCYQAEVDPGRYCTPYLGDSRATTKFCHKETRIWGTCDQRAFYKCHNFCAACTTCRPCSQVIVGMVTKVLSDPKSTNMFVVSFEHYDSVAFYEQKQLYTWDVLLSNIGGILGLCCGVSLLSVAQLIWYWIVEPIKKRFQNASVEISLKDESDGKDEKEQD